MKSSRLTIPRPAEECSIHRLYGKPGRSSAREHCNECKLPVWWTEHSPPHLWPANIANDTGKSKAANDARKYCKKDQNSICTKGARPAARGRLGWRNSNELKVWGCAFCLPK
eukprot:9001322-Karenia_brevis.AAC.1